MSGRQARAAKYKEHGKFNFLGGPLPITPQDKFLGGLAAKVIGPWAKVTKRKGNYEPPGIYNFLHNILGASNPQGNMSKKSLKSQKKPCSH